MDERKLDYWRLFVHMVSLAPLVLLVWDLASGGLSFNPIQEITHRTGRDALVLLLLALSCSPLGRLPGLRAMLRVRRALGVYAFTYASLHFLTFIGLDNGLNPALIIDGIFRKPFALVGFCAWLMLLLLAVTSTKGWKRRLGRNWKKLHRLIYIAVPLVIIHFLWSAKQDYSEPLTYGAVVAVLLILRLPLPARPGRQGVAGRPTS